MVLWKKANCDLMYQSGATFVVGMPMLECGGIHVKNITNLAKTSNK